MVVTHVKLGVTPEESNGYHVRKPSRHSGFKEVIVV